MAVTKATDQSLATSVGLTDDDLVAMYRLVLLARSLDERMWILNRAGRIPFVISGQGHEGRAGRHHLAAPRRGTTGSHPSTGRSPRA